MAALETTLVYGVTFYYLLFALGAGVLDFTTFYSGVALVVFWTFLVTLLLGAAFYYFLGAALAILCLKNNNLEF